jgi:predicted Zn-dependent protease
MIKKTLLLIVLSIVMSACAARNAVPVGLIPKPVVPDPKEVSSVRYAVENTMATQNGWKMYQYGDEYVRVRRIIDRLQYGAKITNYSYPLYIADAGDDVNASAVSNNVIIVYKALANKVPNDAQLAAVLGHEIAHILARHTDDTSSEERAETLGWISWILGNAASVAVSAAGMGDGLAQTAGELTQDVSNTVGVGAVVLAYDRRLEYEADHIGMMIMARAGYDPKYALEFWKNADTIFGGTSGSFFSTHPSNEDRQEKLQEYLPIAEEYYREAKKYY